MTNIRRGVEGAARRADKGATHAVNIITTPLIWLSNIIRFLLQVLKYLSFFVGLLGIPLLVLIIDAQNSGKNDYYLPNMVRYSLSISDGKRIGLVLAAGLGFGIFFWFLVNLICKLYNNHVFWLVEGLHWNANARERELEKNYRTFEEKSGIMNDRMEDFKKSGNFKEL